MGTNRKTSCFGRGGNYVKHERLFGKENFGPAWSPPRIWRILPSYDLKILGSPRTSTKTLHLRSGGHGFCDYDNQRFGQGGSTDGHIATAAKQLTKVRLINGKTSKKLLDPTQLFDLITLPTPLQPQNRWMTPSASCSTAFSSDLLLPKNRNFQAFAIKSGSPTASSSHQPNLRYPAQARGSLPLELAQGELTNMT